MTAALPHLDCTMNFCGPIEGRARVDVPAWSRSNIALEPHNLPIRDARAIRDTLSLDREGFALLDHPSVLRSTDDPDEVMPRYLASVAEMLRAELGAAIVVPQANGTLKRHSERAGRATFGPSRWVHRDYTLAAAPKWLGWMEQWNGASYTRYPRWAVIQTWRCLTPPPCDNTLVLCDASSIDQARCVPFDACLAQPYDAPGNQFEAEFSAFDPAQRWYYFSDLTPNELIVFKGFDSDPDRFAQPLHNSIDLPGDNAAPRASVEARFFAFFDAA